MFCALVIPIAGFVFLLGANGIMQMHHSNARIELLFDDLSDNERFFNVYVEGAFRNAEEVFSFSGQDGIANMNYLEWVGADNWHSFWGDWGDDERQAYRYELLSTNFPRSRTLYGSLEVSDSMEFLSSQRAQDMMNNAMMSQLAEYSFARTELDNAAGLYYFVTDGERILSNLPIELQNAEFFQSQPVFLIGGIGNAIQTSLGFPRHTHFFRDAGGIMYHLAFSQEVVDWRNAQWLHMQRQLGGYVAIVIASVFVALAALVVLLTGAGRVVADQGSKVHFTVLDRPWLDVSLGVLGVYSVMVLAMLYQVLDAAWRSGRMLWIFVFYAILSVCFTLPITGWLMSFAKRCKAGRFWRHTLAYTFAGWMRGMARGLVVSAWAGLPLTVRILLAGGALLVWHVFLIALAHDRRSELALLLSVILIAAAVLIMLRYARKLYLVEIGARTVCNGDYGSRIGVIGGKLGSIAASINSISDGINSAVSQRMKSERLKTELITNVSHDIRTPLTSLITYTDLLKHEGLNSEKAPEYLDILIQKTTRLKALTDDLFEASKAASGNIDVNMETIDLADFVRQVLGEMDERVRASGLEFRLNLPQHTQVLADGKLLWRVVENLLSNIFKYAMPGSRVYVDITPEEQWCRVDLKNISEYPLNVDPSELVERFKRGDSARTGEGSGLGLSIAQSFMQSQGGHFALAIDGDLFKVTLRLQRS